MSKEMPIKMNQFNERETKFCCSRVEWAENILQLRHQYRVYLLTYCTITFYCFEV